MKAQLKFLNGERTGEVFPLREGRTVVGRQVGDITLADKEVSSIHAIISYERNGWFVMDLGSTNGVWVNDDLQPESQLTDGCEIRMGQTRLLFNDSGASPSVEEPAIADAPREDETASANEAPPLFPGAAEQTMEVPIGVPAAREAVLDEEIEFAGALQEAGVERGGVSSFEIVLEVMDGADEGLVYRFNNETILLGRLNTDLVVRDSDVSRRHAIIEVFEDNLVYIRDLGSTNGTFVNGKRISTVKLNQGDKLKLGRCTLSFDYKLTE